MAEPRRILIIRPSALGDVCRTVPALASLRRRYPDATIDWLVRDAFSPAVSAHPDLSGVIPFPRERFAAAGRSPRVTLAAVRWALDLRKGKYDVVYDLQGLFRSAMFALATRAPRRVGRSPSREMAFLGLTTRHPTPREAHDVDATLSVLRADGVTPVPDMRLYAPPADRAALHDTLNAVAAGGGRYAVLAPTARWPGKRWPEERFSRVAEGMLHAGLVDVAAIVGARGEEAQCPALCALASREPRVVNLIGRTGVGGLMAVIERAAVVIANDSASLHMAVGFDRPLVALFGPTRVERVGPYGRSADVIQHARPGDRFEHKREEAGGAMMARITEDEVLRAARERLDGPAAQGRRRIAHPTMPVDAAAPA